MMKNVGGRPIKLTNEVIETVVDGISKGLTLKAACKSAGVSYSTLASWVYKGKQAKKAGKQNLHTEIADRIQGAYRAIWLKNRKSFFFNLKPRDYRYGWKNPMSEATKRRIRETYTFRLLRSRYPELYERYRRLKDLAKEQG